MSIIDIQDSIVLYGIIWLPQKGGLISFERDFYLVSGLIFYDSMEIFFFFLFLSPITILVDIYKYRYFVVHFIALLISEYLSQWVRKFQTEENLLNI